MINDGNKRRYAKSTYRTTDDYTPPASVKEPSGGLYGWICPKCGAVMSPYQEFCVKCSGSFDFTWTANSNTTGTKYTISPSSESSINADKSRCHKCVYEMTCLRNKDIDLPLDYFTQIDKIIINGTTFVRSVD